MVTEWTHCGYATMSALLQPVFSNGNVPILLLKMIRRCALSCDILIFSAFKEKVGLKWLCAILYCVVFVEENGKGEENRTEV